MLAIRELFRYRDAQSADELRAMKTKLDAMESSLRKLKVDAEVARKVAEQVKANSIE